MDLDRLSVVTEGEFPFLRYLVWGTKNLKTSHKKELTFTLCSAVIKVILAFSKTLSFLRSLSFCSAVLHGESLARGQLKHMQYW